MKILNFDSVCIWSENPKKLAKFYGEVLELPYDMELNLPDDTGVQFKIGDVLIWIGFHDKVKGKSQEPFRIMPGFHVESVNKVYEELTKKNVEFIQKPIISPTKDYYVATILDPEGNIIQFYSDNP